MFLCFDWCLWALYVSRIKTTELLFALCKDSSSGGNGLAGAIICDFLTIELIDFTVGIREDS